MDMTNGNLWKQIGRYSLPLMATNLLQLFFNIADVAIVGKCAGALSLGAVGSTSLLIALTTGWLIGMANGVNAETALYIGAGNRSREKRTVNTGFVLCLLFGFLVLLTGVLASRPVLELMGTKEELIEEAVLYFRLYMLGSPALGLFNFGNAVLSAAGDTKKPLGFLTVSGIINIALNLFFVLGLGMTADGVAIASILSQYVAAFLILRELCTTKNDYRLNLRSLSLDAESTGKILRISIPAAIQYSLFSVANLFVQAAVNTFDHVTVEGNSAAMNFDAVVYECMGAVYTATTSFIAQNFGAGKKERIKAVFGITTLYSFLVAFVPGIFIHLFRVPLLYLFTNDAAVVEKGAIRLGILSLSYCLSAFMDNATAASRGLGKTVLPTVIVLLGSVAFRLIWIYTVFAYVRTLPSLYLLYGCAFVFTGILGNLYFFSLYKRL